MRIGLAFGWREAGVAAYWCVIAVNGGFVRGMRKRKGNQRKGDCDGVKVDFFFFQRKMHLDSE